MMYQYSIITALMMIVSPSIAASLIILLQDVQSERGHDYLCSGRGYMLTLYILEKFYFQRKIDLNIQS